MAKESDYVNIICPIFRKVWKGNFKSSVWCSHWWVPFWPCISHLPDVQIETKFDNTAGNLLWNLSWEPKAWWTQSVERDNLFLSKGRNLQDEIRWKTREKKMCMHRNPLYVKIVVHHCGKSKYLWETLQLFFIETEHWLEQDVQRNVFISLWTCGLNVFLELKSSTNVVVCHN